MKLPTKEEAQGLLGEYRGTKGKYKKDLGDDGVRALWVLCEGSPSSAMEFLGYSPDTESYLSRVFKSVGLEPIQRDRYSNEWARYPNQHQTIDDIRARYLYATQGPETAYQYDWHVPNAVADDPGYVTLVTVSDLHYGHAAMDYQRWLKLRNWIGDNPHVRWIFLGDLFDQATSMSPGRSALEQELTYDEACNLALADLKPIAGQCIGLHRGNHDERIASALKIDYDPIKEIARQINVPYLGYESYVRYTIKTYKPRKGKRRTNVAQEYIGYHHHGVGGGQTWGSFFNTMERLEKNNEADFIVMGHRHQRAAVTKTRRTVARNNSIVIDDVQLVGAGCFLKHESKSYAAAHGYAPSVLGAATLHLYLDRHSAHSRA